MQLPFFSKVLSKNINRYAIFIIFCSLMGCATHKEITALDRLQRNYNSVALVNQQYLHGDYGKPDPVSFPRLKRYQFEAWQAVAQFREKTEKNQFDSSRSDIQHAEAAIDQYRSYLAALGATSATPQ